MLGLLHRTREDDGITLPELLVAMFIFGIVMLVFTSTLASVQGGVVHQDNLSRTNDQARLALEQLDREIRSGNVLYDPALESDPNYVLRVYTQTNFGTPREAFMCALWMIDEQRQLLTRRWDPQGDGGTNWRVVATGIVNKELGVPAFALDPDPLRGDRTLRVTLRVNENIDRFPNATFELTQALTGRNTSYGFPVSVCGVIPPLPGSGEEA
ncbi:MAG TPA: prepilin-type N-terminal cleavage/methylation domain-containing protein [Actinomycetota bacterium]|nr:prepilin-type N-terminal cleavage/methylation domain-containing protein [Actinomycetota bacterium]